MPACPNCGAEAPEQARFCSSCGAQLEPARETRKVVTLLFCDWVGSTPLGEALDAESLRRVQEAFFADARRVLERHGGTVEKFIGDEVMAVFGIPQAHEDDALRAARAAAELRDAVAALHQRLQQLPVRLSVRTGLNTGEVVAGDPGAGQAFVTGDGVVVGKRFQESAKPGEILIGETTRALIRNAAVLEPVEPLTLKGKALPVSAWRLIEVLPVAPGVARRLDVPLVDREHELTLLRQAFERSVHESTGHLVTVLGAAGVGKSRIVSELLTGAHESATALVGRCLPYGEGITFWPLVDIVRQAASIGPDLDASAARGQLAELVADDPDSDLTADRIAAAIGLIEGTASTEETFLAVRRLLGALGRRGPVVLALDDVQWAEPTFFDLIEYLADWIRDMPVLIVCLARPELLDERPTWAGGKLNATTILLEPLGDDDCSELVQNLLGQADAPDRIKREVTAAAEGNPLFVEEMIAMLIDDSSLRLEDGSWVADDVASVQTPPTIQALVGARLDRLTAEERVVIEVAAVIGKFFSRSAIARLAPAGDLDRLLEALVRKELIRHERDAFLGDDAFRFRHMLIRDGAYGGLPKARRAELHERHATFLAELPGDRLMAVEELVGYHLEHAFRYRDELGLIDEDARDLAGRAGEHLAAAGHRALARNDIPAALDLLERSPRPGGSAARSRRCLLGDRRPLPRRRDPRRCHRCGKGGRRRSAGGAGPGRAGVSASDQRPRRHQRPAGDGGAGDPGIRGSRRRARSCKGLVSDRPRSLDPLRDRPDGGGARAGPRPCRACRRPAGALVDPRVAGQRGACGTAAGRRRDQAL
jgi:class 3 adenylate cyclase